MFYDPLYEQMVRRAALEHRRHRVPGFRPAEPFRAAAASWQSEQSGPVVERLRRSPELAVGPNRRAPEPIAASPSGSEETEDRGVEVAVRSEAAASRDESDAGGFAEEFASEQDRLRAALKDLEAAKARVERDAERERVRVRAELVAELFPVLDSLDRSIAVGSSDGGLLEGVKMVREQLEAKLRGYGLERIPTKGCAFDPRVHEAVDVAWVDDPDAASKVVDEWEAGYRFGDHVLRAAKVRVGRLRSAE